MNKVEIRIDKRTELMSVLLYISNYRKEFPNWYFMTEILNM